MGSEGILGNPLGRLPTVGFDESDAPVGVIAGTFVGVAGLVPAKRLGEVGLAPVAVGVCWGDMGVW